MGSRSRSGRPIGTAVFVIFALVATGVVAFAGTAPAPGNYPSITATVKGSGIVDPCTGSTLKSCSRFSFVVQRRQNGSLKGHVTIRCADGFSGLRAATITGLSITGNQATFTAVGRAIQPGGRSSTTPYGAQVTVTDGSPDTFSAIVVDNATNPVCTPSGALTTRGSGVKIQDGLP